MRKYKSFSNNILSLNEIDPKAGKCVTNGRVRNIKDNKEAHLIMITIDDIHEQR